MPYWQLYYHLVWSTKGREPLLSTRAQPIVYGFLRSKAIGLGATLFALGGIEDHVHMVVSIPPSVAVARFVGQVKGIAATLFNKSGNAAVLHWQEEYGAFSFDGRRLPDIVAYVEHQVEHHSQNSLIPVLERTSDRGAAMVREESTIYLAPPEGYAT